MDEEVLCAAVSALVLVMSLRPSLISQITEHQMRFLTHRSGIEAAPSLLGRVRITYDSLLFSFSILLKGRHRTTTLTHSLFPATFGAILGPFLYSEKTDALLWLLVAADLLGFLT